MTVTIADHPFKLSVLDHSTPPCYIRFVLMFSMQDVAAAVSRLETGAELLIREMPFLASDLDSDANSLQGGTGLVEMRPRSRDKADILQVHPIDSSYDEICSAASERDVGCAPLSFFPEPSRPAPIFRLQVNSLRDGIALGIALHHGLIDGTGIGVFVHKLASCCRGPVSSSFGPSVRGSETTVATQRVARDMLTAYVHETPPLSSQEKLEHSKEFTLLSDIPEGIGGFNDGVSEVAKSLSSRYFRLSAAKIRDLKALCNRFINESTHLQLAHGNTRWVSSNDLVVSLLGICVSRAREAAHSRACIHNHQQEGLGICMAVDVRKRLDPPLPAGFFGNAVLLLRLCSDINISPDKDASGEDLQELPHDALLQQSRHPNIWQIGLCRVALSVRQRLNAVDDSYVRSVLTYLSEVSGPAIPTYNPANLHVSSWRDIGVYEANFGPDLGHAREMYLQNAMVNDLFTVMPRRGRSESDDTFWEIHVSVHRDIMDCLLSDRIWTSCTA